MVRVRVRVRVRAMVRVRDPIGYETPEYEKGWVRNVWKPTGLFNSRTLYGTPLTLR